MKKTNLENSKTLLQWEKPSCIGWREVSHYRISIIDNTEKFKIYATVEPSVTVKGEVIKFAINATNICKETIQLEQLSNNNGIISPDNYYNCFIQLK